MALHYQVGITEPWGLLQLTPRFPSPRPSHRNPRSKDLRYEGKSSMKAFLHKYVGLARSEQWTEVEQHDQFCFALEGMAC